MVVPDFELICEIMLVAEGFQEARLLARKFITLYMLCRELLSKQDHYDWGLRAIKSVLVVAGKLKRDDRQRPEEQVLMRALRDFNMPKIVTDDVPVFMGLIGRLIKERLMLLKLDVRDTSRAEHNITWRTNVLVHHILYCSSLRKFRYCVNNKTFVKNIFFSSFLIVYNNSSYPRVLVIVKLRNL